MKVLVTGGCGYVGSVLTGSLVAQGHDVSVVDLQWFGHHLPAELPIELLKVDVRDIDAIPLDGVDAVIHLANVANDPGVELDETLSWEINALGTQQLADKAARSGVGQFIFASSGSVYGVKDEPDVTEDLSLVPISAYNKTKMVAERAVLSYQDAMQVHCIRPATVCGYSPRMRFDVSVNMFVMQAFRDQRMTVFGGDQVRPNIHIDDLVDVYHHFLANPSIPSGAYNAGFENISILDIADRVAALTGAEIAVSASNDPRSYRQNSDLLVSTGYQPKRDAQAAIEDVYSRLQAGTLTDSDEWYTVRRMKQLAAAE